MTNNEDLVFETPQEDENRILYPDKTDADEKSLEETKRNRGNWIKEKNKSYYIRLNLEADKEVIEYFERQKNKKGYITKLIEDDLNREDHLEF